MSKCQGGWCRNTLALREVDVKIPLLAGMPMSKYLCSQGGWCQNTFAVKDVNVKIPLLSGMSMSKYLCCQGGLWNSSHVSRGKLLSQTTLWAKFVERSLFKINSVQSLWHLLNAFQTPLHQWHFIHDKLSFPWWPVSPGVVEPPWICPPYTPCITSYNMSLTKLHF